MADGSRSYPPPPTSSGWAAWTLPSVADLIFLVLLALLLFTPLSIKLLSDAGIGWHIRTGQQILATHAISHSDPFSSTMAGTAWFAWEWAYDLVVGALESAFGLNGVVWLTAVVIAAVFAAVMRMLILRAVSVCASLALTLLAISASTIHFLARPHVFSWLATLAWFWILESSESCAEGKSPQAKRLWLLPVLMLVWVNVHGGFLIGFVLLVLFWLGAAWEFAVTSRDRLEDSLSRIAASQRLRILTLVGVLSAIASLINPYGWSLHAHVYRYLSNRFLMDHVEEFQSPNFHQLAPRCFLILLLISVAIAILRARRLRMSNALTLLFAIYAGLYASRNLPISSILLALIAGILLCGRNARAPASIDSKGFLARMTAIERRQRGHLWCFAAAAATLLICLNGGRLGATSVINAHFSPQRMPVAAVDFIAQQGIKDPIFAPDYWGGYLIYRLYPSSRVVIDDRHDLYGEQFLKSYLVTFHAEPDWQQFLDAHRVSYVLFPRSAALSTALSESSAWKRIYGDDKATLFERPSRSPN